MIEISEYCNMLKDKLSKIQKRYLRFEEKVYAKQNALFDFNKICQSKLIKGA